jgi:serine/threonine-protein kinase
LPERYEVIRRLAIGGMASVWCAHDRALDRNVAIKVMSARFAHHEAAVRRFKREARAAARLSGHPNVVTIYDVGHTSPSDEAPAGRAFMVMEHLVGGTVADALRLGVVAQPQAVRWLHEAAAALDYAHAEGVLHRDVKPGNMLLDRERVLHLADFGIARVPTEDTLTSAGEVFGTASYLAPERALGHHATDASDRYSLAVAAYELLVGERPFSAEHYAAMARQHVEEEPPPASVRNPALPRAVDAVLARGLAKRPQQRWPTAQAFAEAIKQALGEASGRATPPTFVHLRRQPRPRRRASALAALAAAAFGVGIAAGASQPDHTRTPHAAALAQRPRSHASVSARRVAPRPRPHRRVPPAGKSGVSATRAAASTPPPRADMLEARGHELMLEGRYSAAIAVLHGAVAAASPSSLTYAYALYDLGRSLRLSGDPRAAIPILWRRMQIPNQTDVVRAELQLALQEVGARERASGGAAPASPKHAHKHHGRDGDHGD